VSTNFTTSAWSFRQTRFWPLAASLAAKRRYFGISPAFEFGSTGAGAAGAAG